MFPRYEQSTCESCLAVCLLLLVQKFQQIKKINKKLELKLLTSALRFSKLNFVIGHLEYITRHFNVNVEWYIENYSYYRFVKKLKKSLKISLRVKNISLRFLNGLLKQYPIVYIDDYILRNTIHYPHFIIVFAKNGSKYKIFDPWDGKEKLIESRVLMRGIMYLRNYLKFTPQVIIIKPRTASKGYH